MLTRWSRLMQWTAALLTLAAVPAAGAISFKPPVLLQRHGAGPLTAADLDADGKVDLAVSGIGGQGSLSLFYGNGDGTFQAPTHLALQDGVSDVHCADVNGDERLDFVLAHTPFNRVAILMNQGGRAYAPPVSYEVGLIPIALTTADLNGDGRLDLAVSNHHSNNLCVLLNQGDGTFGAPVFYPGGSYTARVVSGDFNRDGHADLAMSNYVSGNVILYIGDGTGRLTVTREYRVGSYPGHDPHARLRPGRPAGPGDGRHLLQHGLHTEGQRGWDVPGAARLRCQLRPAPDGGGRSGRRWRHGPGGAE